MAIQDRSLSGSRLGRAMLTAGVLLYSVGLVWLHRLDAEGPPHGDIILEQGVPGTLYLPRGEIGPFAVQQPSPAPEPPPAVLLMHGYTGDRIIMSGLARSLARSGYAVLSIDLRGHGQNRTPLAKGSGAPDHFVPDIAAAVEFLRATPHVDGSRVALIGYSMGARAALAYTTLGARVDAVVLISGGWVLAGPHRPPNALFVHAERDLPSVPIAAERITAQLAGVESAEAGRIYGDFSAGTALRRVEIPETRHGSIIRSGAAFAAILDWLDQTYGISRTDPAGYVDARPLAAGVALAGFLLLLAPLGAGVARLVPCLPDSSVPSSVRDLLPLVAALLVSLPVFYAVFPGVLLGASHGDRSISYLALSGLLLFAAVGVRGWQGVVATGSNRLAGVCIGAAGVVVAYLLLNPIALAVRGVGLTPERALTALATSIFLFPFSLSFHVLLRRGSLPRRTLLALAGRGITLGALALGAAIGVFAGGEGVVALALLPTYAMLEIVFGAYYVHSRNVIPASVLESLWVGWILAAILPTNW